MHAHAQKQLTIRDAHSGLLIGQGILGDDVIELEGCYYFKPELIDMRNLVLTARTYTCSYKGTCFWVDLKTESGRVENIGFSYQHVKDGYERIKNRIGFYGRSMRGLSVEFSEIH